MKDGKLMWLGLSIIIVGGLSLAGYGMFFRTVKYPDIGYNRPLQAASGSNTPAKTGLVPPGGSKITTIYGVISAFDADGLIIHRVAVNLDDPNAPQGPAERTIVIATDTPVVALVPLTPKEATAAFKKYQDSVKAGLTDLVPSQVKEVKLTPNDLRLTMSVIITAADDIRNSETIKASKIAFYAPPSTPPLSKK